MAQTWRRLLFAHWQVDPEQLRRVVPPQLPLDLHAGRAFVGITPFRVEGLRLRWTLPPPYASRFPELNVRTYVTLEDKPGIHFLSLDASRRIAVTTARRTYRLPYFHARMSLVPDDDGARMRHSRLSSDGPPAELDCVYAASGERFTAAPGSIEHWLTERYCLYTLDESGTPQRGEIHHPPWPLQPARASFATNTMVAGHRLTLAGDPLLHYSDRQDVLLWAIQPVGR
jgi:uncharacterized protein YqjF (DUF2071 family)